MLACAYVALWFDRNLNRCSAVHFWCTSMMLGSPAYTTTRLQNCWCKHIYSKANSKCPWPLGLQGTLYFLHCAVTISCIIPWVFILLLFSNQRKGNGYIYTHIYYIYIYIHMYMPTVHQQCWEQLMPQNAACMHAEVYSWPFICIEWC